ncbi:hypothetical protein [Streptomyces sp. TS71-3]|uniref:hypothetical protein n=1 Tax=Streptomyces sp. TS71-3 TaxID=2733862 RepID=UPI001B17E6F4|nr:hypothetical protein [Streptomyces sp. TS71-3]GHJ36110.1 hypothetical protein Sm713_17190 [Streptomyces sp. TS71-3]
MPAGKAFALAAMPTAVLMGMGLTPTFAAAKGLPKNPASDGHCVSQPDEVPDDGSKKADDGKTTDGKGLFDQKPGASDSDGKSDPSASPSPSASATPSGSTKSAPSGDTKDDSPAPSASKSSGGLLGDLGDSLGNVLSGGQGKSTSSDAGTSTPTPSASQSGKSSDSLVDKVVGSATDTAGKVGDTTKKVTDGVKDTAGKAASPSPSTGDLLGQSKGEDGSPSYPCVVEKKTAGKDETPPVPIPNQPWNLQASSLLLKGLNYAGVVNLTTPDGHTKQVLKFTADDGVDIGDLHQTVAGQGGKTYHVQAASGSTSTIRGGRVTMYTESLSGNLFGLIPIVFDAEHPPPLNIPVAYFTNVKIVQAGQFGGNLTVPGLHQYLTG